MPAADANSYDELPYEDNAYYLTHPSNLAAVATLCGLRPAAPDDCRVLELGCGAGFNLLAMAHSLPAARFVGVDLSPREIARGRSLAATLKCDRVELVAGDVAEVAPSLGEFDYIVAHGLLSWVPAAVRTSIFRLIDRLLTPRGVAYLSYNTYPGWHVRTILRDALRFFAPEHGTRLDQIRQARAGAEQLAAALPAPDTTYGRFLRTEVEALRGDSDQYAYHEFLEEDNHPLRFQEFAGQASANGLQFLAEARYGTNSFAQGPEVQRAFDAVSGDLVRREQYHDLLRNRSFRQSLLCRAELRPTRSPTLRDLAGLRVCARVELFGGSGAGLRGGAERFRLHGTTEVATSDPVRRGLLRALRDSWPRPKPAGEVVTRVAAKLGPGTEEQVADSLVRGYADGLWLLLAYDPPFAARPGDCPRACPLARHEAELGPGVTNRLHRPVVLSDSERALLRRLDGSTPRERLAAAHPDGRLGLEVLLRRLAESALLEA